jgi:hypothetical protein
MENQIKEGPVDFKPQVESSSGHHFSAVRQPSVEASFLSRFTDSLKAKHLLPQKTSPQVLLAGVVGIFLVFGLVATFLLARTGQDLRQQASGETYLNVATGSSCSGIPASSYGCDSDDNRLVCDGFQWRSTGQKCNPVGPSEPTISCFEYEYSSGNCIQRGSQTRAQCQASYAFGGDYDYCVGLMNNRPAVEELPKEVRTELYGSSVCHGDGQPGDCRDRDPSNSGVLIQVCRGGSWSPTGPQECLELKAQLQQDSLTDDEPAEVGGAPTTTCVLEDGSSYNQGQFACTGFRSYKTCQPNGQLSSETTCPGGSFCSNRGTCCIKDGTTECFSNEPELEEEPVLEEVAVVEPEPAQQCYYGVQSCAVLGRVSASGCSNCSASGYAACCGALISEVEQVCTPSTRRCRDFGTMEVCNSSGQTWLPISCTGGKVCLENACVVATTTTSEQSQTSLPTSSTSTCSYSYQCAGGRQCLPQDYGRSPSGPNCGSAVSTQATVSPLDLSICSEALIAQCNSLDNAALGRDWECVVREGATKASCQLVSEAENGAEEPDQVTTDEQSSSGGNVISSAVNQACGFLGTIGINVCEGADGSNQPEETNEDDDAISLAATGLSCGSTSHGAISCITRSGSNGGSYYLCDNGRWHQNSTTYYCGAGNTCVNGSCGCESGNCQSPDVRVGNTQPDEEEPSEAESQYTDDCSNWHFGYYQCPAICNKDVAVFSTCEDGTVPAEDTSSTETNFSEEDGYVTSTGSEYSQLDYEGTVICGNVPLDEAGCGIFVTAQLLDISPLEAAEFFCAGGENQYVADSADDVGETAVVSGNGTSLSGIQGVLSDNGVEVGEVQLNVTYNNGVDYAVDQVEQYSSIPNGDVVVTIDHVVCTNTSCRIVGHQIIVTGVSYDSAGNPILNAEDSIYDGGWRVCSQASFDVNNLSPSDEGCAIIKHILPVQSG